MQTSFRYILLLVGQFAIACCAAQVPGAKTLHVQRSSDKRPVPHATIQHNGVFGFADSLGKFLLNATGADTLIVSSVGFKPDTVVADAGFWRGNSKAMLLDTVLVDLVSVRAYTPKELLQRCLAQLQQLSKGAFLASSNYSELVGTRESWKGISATSGYLFSNGYVDPKDEWGVNDAMIHTTIARSDYAINRSRFKDEQALLIDELFYFRKYIISHSLSFFADPGSYQITKIVDDKDSAVPPLIRLDLQPLKKDIPGISQLWLSGEDLSIIKIRFENFRFPGWMPIATYRNKSRKTKESLVAASYEMDLFTTPDGKIFYRGLTYEASYDNGIREFSRLLVEQLSPNPITPLSSKFFKVTYSASINPSIQYRPMYRQQLFSNVPSRLLDEAAADLGGWPVLEAQFKKHEGQYVHPWANSMDAQRQFQEQYIAGIITAIEKVKPFK
ncbi:MAG: hypothetical protein ABW007_24150 [Chitinophagaceae bacterium]